MAPVKPVKILDQCKVAPPQGSVAPTCTALPLTFFDILWLPLPPVELLYFYEFPYPISQFNQSLLPQLKQSLSSTLIHFYPFSGNLSWPHEPNHPMICYTEGDSISFTVAESDADFYHLSSNYLKDAIDSRPLVPHLPTSGPIIPISAIQVTVFPNNGICIGITHHHMICDGRGFSHFMRTWASISKLGVESISPKSLPFLDRTIIKDHHGITKLFLNDLDRLLIGAESVSGNNRILRVMDIKLPPNMVRATLDLNEATCRRLKEWVFSQYKKDERTQKPSVLPSRLVSICAYTWICLLKAEAKAGESNTNNITRFAFNVDCRARLEPPISETYFGNCVTSCTVIAEKTDLISGGVAVAAQLMRKRFDEMDEEILRGMEHAISYMLEMLPCRTLAAAGSPHFGYYEANFGFGKPKKVELASIDRTGAIFLKENPKEDGGIEFDLVLNRQEMDAFVYVFLDGLNALT